MENIISSYIDRVDQAILKANESIKIKQDPLFWYKKRLNELNTKLSEPILKMGGMSTPEVRIFLNELVDRETNYLEIGSHTGSTFVSAMYGNKPRKSFAIDIFESEKILKTFLENCQLHKLNTFTLIRNDSFKLNETQKQMIEDINVYFYDGAHDEIDHEMALTYYYDNLSKAFILIVDDWVHPEAVAGTISAIKKLNLKVHKKWELGYSQHFRKFRDDLSWHNGLYVAVLEKQL